jgi:hypothetical protein
MPAKRLSMRKIKEVLRLKFELQLKNREIALKKKSAYASLGRARAASFRQTIGSGFLFPFSY